ncbi:MAG TPA: HIT family protein [Candidatus Nanopusillus sp.]|nr:HIT family protein [Candidatus Nanopusillus sp.]
MECVFCKIASKQLASFIIFEDNDIIAVLDLYPANPGHILVFPKNHFSRFEDIPDNIIGKMFVLAKYISSVLTSTLNADGINLYLASGKYAGQKTPHIVLHIIPRYKEDSIHFEWSRKQLNPQVFQQIQNAIVSALNKYNTNRNYTENIHINKDPTKTEVFSKDKKTNRNHKDKEKDYSKMLIWFLRKI